MSRAIPEGSEGVIPYLCIDGASDAIELYKKVFGATEIYWMAQPDGRIGHAEIRIHGRPIYIADEFAEMGFHGPKHYGGTPVMLHLYVEDVDATMKAAEESGAKITRPAETQFYGDRGGSLLDPYGHNWYVSTHVEDVSEDEIQRRAQEKLGKKE
ncbi:MAG: VOC family protein [Acidobacteria bacterium]|nr:VOC family protein [Acidobacteriota bacterium]